MKLTKRQKLFRSWARTYAERAKQEIRFGDTSEAFIYAMRSARNAFIAKPELREESADEAD